MANSVAWTGKEKIKIIEDNPDITRLLQNNGLDALAKNVKATALMDYKGEAEKQIGFEEWSYTDDQDNKIQLRTRAFPEELASTYFVTFGQEEGGFDSGEIGPDRETWARIIQEKLADLGLPNTGLISGVLNNLWRETSLVEIGLKNRQILNVGNDTTRQLITHQNPNILVNVKLDGECLVVTHTVRHQLAIQDHETEMVSETLAMAEHTLEAKILLQDPKKIILTWTPEPFAIPVPELETFPALPGLVEKAQQVHVEKPKIVIIEDYNPCNVADDDLKVDDFEEVKPDLRSRLEAMSYTDLRDCKYSLALEALEEAFPDASAVPNTPLGAQVEVLMNILKSCDYASNYERYTEFRTTLQTIFGSTENQR